MKPRNVQILETIIILLLFVICLITLTGCSTNYPENVAIAMENYDNVRSEVYYKSGQRVVDDSRGNCVAFSREIRKQSIYDGVRPDDIATVLLERATERHMALRVYDGVMWWIAPSTGCIGEYAMPLSDYVASCNYFDNSWWIVDD